MGQMVNILKKVLILFTLIPFHSQACEAPITFQAGPFFSTSLIIRYWQPFTQSVEEITGCKTEIKTTPTYPKYLRQILNKSNDMYIVPDHYVSAVQELGFTPVLASYKTAQIYFASKHPMKHGDLKALHGDVITVPSQYTRAYLELKKWLIKNNTFDKVSFDFDHSHDSAALLMLKGKRSSTVILAPIYDKLPDFIKDKFHVVKLNATAGAYIIVNDSVSQKVIDAMIASLDKLAFQKWHKVESIPKEPFSDEFKNQLDHFKRRL